VAANPGREQRRNWRYPCQGNASLYDLITQRRVPGEILDLSISGCLVRPDEPGVLREGDVIEISFTLHGHSIRVMARVQNIRPDHSMGIEFRGRNDEASRRITRLMQKLAEESMRGRQP
jgi:PilZ domain